METITLTGQLDPVAALELRSQLSRATSALRPKIAVDLTKVTSIHIAATAALIHAARQAQRQGGELLIKPPTSTRAQQDLDMASWFPLRRFGNRANQ